MASVTGCIIVGPSSDILLFRVSSLWTLQLASVNQHQQQQQQQLQQQLRNTLEEVNARIAKQPEKSSQYIRRAKIHFLTQRFEACRVDVENLEQLQLTQHKRNSVPIPSSPFPHVPSPVSVASSSSVSVASPFVASSSSSSPSVASPVSVGSSFPSPVSVASPSPSSPFATSISLRAPIDYRVYHYKALLSMILHDDQETIIMYNEAIKALELQQQTNKTTSSNGSGSSISNNNNSSNSGSNSGNRRNSKSTSSSGSRSSRTLFGDLNGPQLPSDNTSASSSHVSSFPSFSSAAAAATPPSSSSHHRHSHQHRLIPISTLDSAGHVRRCDLLNNRALAYFRMGLFPNAVRDLEEALKRDDEPELHQFVYWNNLGLSYYYMHRVKTASKCFSRALLHASASQLLENYHDTLLAQICLYRSCCYSWMRNNDLSYLEANRAHYYDPHLVPLISPAQQRQDMSQQQNLLSPVSQHQQQLGAHRKFCMPLHCMLLPEKLLLHIFMFLPQRDLASVCQINFYMNEIVKNSFLYWKQK